ncbi:hypothetical protein [Winogradskyella sp. MIT101101]|uniref:hypothetical protein n=1 Tax=Winogradskyella sp. MIT101101 TaxID=3098297 RepID=UPI00399C30CD
MKLLLIIPVFFFINISFGQEIESIYLFKKELNNKNGFSYFESDSLVLYKNGEFYRKKYFWNHEVIESEYNGVWSRNNNILELNITSTKEYSKAENIHCSLVRYYKIKRQRIVPKKGFQCEFKTRRLKRILGKY